jgi:hypothetical protein
MKNIFKPMNKFLILSALLSITGIGCAAPPQNPTNLALGKKVLFSPPPNYSPTAKGNTDATNLTDGKISEQKNSRLWYENTSVGWSYPGRFNLAVDLGQNCDIDEIAIRLQNGTVGGGILFPGWVEAFVSNDGEHYTKEAEFSRWNKGDFQKFDITQGKAVGNTWVDTLRFQNLKTQGRFVGLRIYGSAMAVSDELYVFGSPDANAVTGNSGTPSDFTVTQPEVYFHKPYLELANNIPLPVPIGLNTPDENGSDVTLTLDLPPGLQIPGGKIGGIDVASVKPKVLSDGWSEYIFSAKAAKADKVFGQIYMQASGWKDGQTGALRYQFGDANWQSPPMRLPVRAVNVSAAPRLKTIMTSLGWWNGTACGWPDELATFRTLGLNTFPVFGKWMPDDMKDPQWKMLEQARNDGFFISNVDSPVYEIIRNHKDAKEIYDQFADGTVGNKLCICYRGKYYQEMINYFAGMMAKVKPDFASEDIEMWSGGPKDDRNCTRCQADFKASGLPTWEAWQEAKGKEIISDLTTVAQKSIKDAGGHPFQNGVYDFRPGETYQQIFNFNQLYPQLLQRSEVSTYTSLQPGDLEFIGDEARKDRAQLPHSDVMPWNTPGDAGTFSGDDFMWSLLENYANGARGIWFWSSRMWDAEDLIAYNKVIRAIAPVEDVIVNGDLVGASATVQGVGRVSGVKLGSRMMLLVADYFGKSDGTVKVQLNLPAKSSVRDLFTGKIVNASLPAGIQTIFVPLNSERARLLEIAPQ